jgi:Protein of unknown function (DUF2911)
MRRNLVAVGGLILSSVAMAAVPSPAQVASPPAKAQCKFSDGKTIHVDYSSPRMRGRKIFGGLVVYGEVWRAGANDATTFVVDTNVNVAGKSVPAGNYTLFAIPNPDSWQLIINKTTGEWGIPYPGEDSDFARVPMKLSKISPPLEDFTIGFNSDGKVCTLHLDWDTTRASVDITEKK